MQIMIKLSCLRAKSPPGFYLMYTRVTRKQKSVGTAFLAISRLRLLIRFYYT